MLAWFGLPTFQVPKFNIVPMLTFIIVSLATMAEHPGDTITLGKVVGEDFSKTWFHRTLAGDGLATSLGSVLGWTT